MASRHGCLWSAQHQPSTLRLVHCGASDVVGRRSACAVVQGWESRISLKKERTCMLRGCMCHGQHTTIFRGKAYSRLSCKTALLLWVFKRIYTRRHSVHSSSNAQHRYHAFDFPIPAQHTQRVPDRAYQACGSHNNTGMQQDGGTQGLRANPPFCAQGLALTGMSAYRPPNTQLTTLRCITGHACVVTLPGSQQS
jgi:hypothetical protein